MTRAEAVQDPGSKVQSGRFFERETPFGYALVLPAVLYLALFIAYPFLMSIYMSFTDAQAGNQKWTLVGTQNYSCTVTDAGTAWTFVGPSAALNDCNGVLIGHHMVSDGGTAFPEWIETSDGTYVVGHKLAAFTPDGGAGSVPWLLLQGVQHGGTGTLSQAEYIQRLYTDGGIAPGPGCDAGDLVRWLRVPGLVANAAFIDRPGAGAVRRGLLLLRALTEAQGRAFGRSAMNRAPSAAPSSVSRTIGRMCPKATCAGAATGHHISTITPDDAPQAAPSAAPVATGWTGSLPRRASASASNGKAAAATVSPRHFHPWGAWPAVASGTMRASPNMKAKSAAGVATAIAKSSARGRPRAERPRASAPHIESAATATQQTVVAA